MIDNLNKFYNSRKEVIKFFRDYIEIISDAGCKAKKDGAGFKILTPKQMFQILPIALRQVKAGNYSVSLLNEIKQIVILSINQSKLPKSIQ